MLYIDNKPVFPFKFIQEDNFEFEFTLLIGDKFLTTPYTCKDYMQDIFWSENANKPGSIWGLNWKPGQFDTSGARFRMCILGGEVNLRDRVKLMKKFINHFDRAQDFPLTKVLETDNDKMIVVDFSSKWTTSSALVSALTSLVRISGTYNGEDVVQYLEKMEENNLPNYMKKEWERLETTLPRMKALLKGEKVKFDWKELDNMGRSHNCGIVGYSAFPEVD